MASDGEAVAELWARSSLATAMAIRVAATLRLADQIADGRTNAAALAARTEVDAAALGRLLRHLAAVGVLRRDDEGGYALTRLGAVLRDGHPAGLRARLDVASAVGRADLCFVRLLEAVQSGGPVFQAQFGRAFWDDLAADPARRASYDAQMGADIGADAPAIVAACDWGALGDVVDVGGGSGALLIALLQEYPALRGTLVDLPTPAAAARRALSRAGLADRGRAVAGSFFEALPPGAGGYLLSAVLHDWDEAAARAILGRCAEAAGARGAVFVIEKIGAEGGSPRTEMDLRMLVYFGGCERTVAELELLAGAAGLRRTALYPAGSLAIVEFRAA